TNLLGWRDLATSLSPRLRANSLEPAPLLVLVDLFGRLMEFLPALLLGGCRGLVALALFEGDLTSEVAVVLEPLGVEIATRDGCRHFAARFGLVRTVAKAAPGRQQGDILEGLRDRRLVHPRLE